MYKYLPKKYADLFFSENSICIGTLYGYRDMEKKKGISDPLEGSYEDFLHFENEVISPDSPNPNLIHNLDQFIGGLDHPNVNFEFSNCSFTATRLSENFLIYCFSYEKSKEVMKEFEGAEICFEIKDPHTFFQLITKKLQKKLHSSINFLGVWDVDYSDYKRKRIGANSNPIPPVRAKTKNFEHQKELRAIWQVPDDFIIPEPFYIFNITKLRNCCRLVNV